MKRPFSPKVVSANELLSGAVVYFDGGGWTHRLSEAAVAYSAEEADRMAGAAANLDVVIDVYLLDVDPAPAAGPRPRHIRDLLRDRGPSNRPDLGRQAALQGA